MSSEINYINVGKLIFDFENEKSSSLSHIRLHKREAWSVIKVHFYFEILYSFLTKKNPSFSESQKRTFIQIVGAYLKYLKYFVGFTLNFFWLVLTKSRKNLIWFMPMSCDKLQKTKGKNLNVLFDKLIESKKDSNYIYFELPVDQDYKDPSYMQRDLGGNGLIIPYRLLNILLKFSNIHKKKAVQLAASLNAFFQERKMDYQVNSKTIKHYLDGYSAEYYLYSFLLFFLRPKVAFTVDQGAAGKIGAFLNHKVKVVEIQHGMLEEFNPPYVYPESLRSRKNQLVIPDMVAVFGEFHGKVLLRYGYWRKDELFYLGNYRLDSWRQYKPAKDNDDLVILFPTQWHVYSETLKFLEEFVQLLPAGVRLKMKLHPGEKEAHVAGYRKFKEKNQEKVMLMDKTKDIYELIAECDVVLAYDSTTLVEALALGKPCITIPTEAAPEGIHAYMNTNELAGVIRLAKDVNAALEYIHNLKIDPDYRKQWQQEAIQLGEYLYSPDYTKRCADAISQLVGENS